MIKFLSPSSLQQWEKNPREFYLTRVIGMSRIEQTLAMATGSAFDCIIKEKLYKEFVGNPAGTEYDLKTSSKSIETNKEEALLNGMIIYNRYVESGALAALCQDISVGIKGTLRMESTVSNTIGGVPLLGKPDLYFKATCGSSNDINFVLDWKVNGFYSKASPKKGYNVCREPDGSNKVHKDFMPLNKCGITLNGLYNLETISEDWAMQVATYAWLLGAPVGGEIACGIDQIVGRECRVASYRMAISKEFQVELLKRYQALWSIVVSNNYPPEIVEYCSGFGKSGRDAWFDQVCRG